MRRPGLLIVAALLMTNSAAGYWAEDLQATPTRGVDAGDYRAPAPVDDDVELRRYRSPDPGQMILHDTFKRLDLDHHLPHHRVPVQ